LRSVVSRPAAALAALKCCRTGAAIRPLVLSWRLSHPRDRDQQEGDQVRQAALVRKFRTSSMLGILGV
jgi:hypothetical protein